jgi:hypothetical protein
MTALAPRSVQLALDGMEKESWIRSKRQMNRRNFSWRHRDKVLDSISMAMKKKNDSSRELALGRRLNASLQFIGEVAEFKRRAKRK